MNCKSNVVYLLSKIDFVKYEDVSRSKIKHMLYSHVSGVCKTFSCIKLCYIYNIHTSIYIPYIMYFSSKTIQD